MAPITRNKKLQKENKSNSIKLSNKLTSKKRLNRELKLKINKNDAKSHKLVHETVNKESTDDSGPLKVNYNKETTFDKLLHGSVYNEVKFTSRWRNVDASSSDSSIKPPITEISNVLESAESIIELKKGKNKGKRKGKKNAKKQQRKNPSTVIIPKIVIEQVDESAKNEKSQPSEALLSLEVEVVPPNEIQTFLGGFFFVNKNVDKSKTFDVPADLQKRIINQFNPKNDSLNLTSNFNANLISSTPLFCDRKRKLQPEINLKGFSRQSLSNSLNHASKLRIFESVLNESLTFSSKPHSTPFKKVLKPLEIVLTPHKVKSPLEENNFLNKTDSDNKIVKKRNSVMKNLSPDIFSCTINDSVANFTKDNEESEENVENIEKSKITRKSIKNSSILPKNLSFSNQSTNKVTKRKNTEHFNNSDVILIDDSENESLSEIKNATDESSAEKVQNSLKESNSLDKVSINDIENDSQSQESLNSNENEPQNIIKDLVVNLSRYILRNSSNKSKISRKLNNSNEVLLNDIENKSQDQIIEAKTKVSDKNLRNSSNQLSSTESSNNSDQISINPNETEPNFKLNDLIVDLPKYKLRNYSKKSNNTPNSNNSDKILINDTQNESESQIKDQTDEITDQSLENSSKGSNSTKNSSNSDQISINPNENEPNFKLNNLVVDLPIYNLRNLSKKSNNILNSNNSDDLINDTQNESESQIKDQTDEIMEQSLENSSKGSNSTENSNNSDQISTNPIETEPNYKLTNLVVDLPKYNFRKLSKKSNNTLNSNKSNEILIDDTQNESQIQINDQSVEITKQTLGNRSNLSEISKNDPQEDPECKIQDLVVNVSQISINRPEKSIETFRINDSTELFPESPCIYVNQERKRHSKELQIDLQPFEIACNSNRNLEIPDEAIKTIKNLQTKSPEKRQEKDDSALSDIIETSVDEFGFKSPLAPAPRFLKKKINHKPIIAKPGKSFRRSLIKLETDLNESCEGNGFDSRLSIVRKRDSSIRIVPLKEKRLTRRVSILEKYAQTSYAPKRAEEESQASSQLCNVVELANSINNDANDFQPPNIISASSRKKSRSNYIDRPIKGAVVTARDLVLQRCRQTEPVSFEKCFDNSTLQHCQKIGEGVYGEVFLYRNPHAGGGTTVMKIIPIEGDRIVNGERQKKFEEILSEIIISMELSNLRQKKKNHTGAFPEVQKVQCVQGVYPERLLDMWDLFAETKGTENDCPDIFDETQLYVVLELANAGTDLEAFVFNNAKQAYSMFQQVACALAVAESEYRFEHRDLHWGNVLISNLQSDSDPVNFCIDGRNIQVENAGIKATIIDFTLSRMEYDGVVIFNDLSQDPDLFTAEGDYQFEVYRKMQHKNGNNWHTFEPYTNILWLHYILDKALNGLRYKNRKSKVHAEYLNKLIEFKDIVLDSDDAKSFVLSTFT